MLPAIAAVLLFLATGRMIFKTSNEIDDELQSYVLNLNYQFTAVVDSIPFVNRRGIPAFCTEK